MDKPTILIIRSCSGNGKSTLAEYLKFIYDQGVLNEEACVCCADDYMFENGQYKFDASKLGFAHRSCQIKFDKAIDNRVGLIIVANTNTKYSDFSYYLEKGQKAGYLVHVITLEKYHEGQNLHQVPLQTLERQERNIRESLKLK